MFPVVEQGFHTQLTPRWHDWGRERMLLWLFSCLVLSDSDPVDCRFSRQENWSGCHAPSSGEEEYMPNTSPSLAGRWLGPLWPSLGALPGTGGSPSLRPQELTQWHRGCSLLAMGRS